VQSLPLTLAEARRPGLERFAAFPGAQSLDLAALQAELR
jgi:hypothetical protein